MKKVISLIIVCVMSMLLIVAADNTVELVGSVSVTPTEVSITGYANADENISIALLNEGYSLSDLENIENEIEFMQIIGYTTVVTADYKGKYTVEFEVADTLNTTLYVTNGRQTYLKTIDECITRAEEIDVNFIDYRENKIMFKGKATPVNSQVTVLVLKENYTIEDYLENPDKAVISSNEAMCDEYGQFEIYTDDVLENGKTYNAYVVGDTASYVSKNMYKLQRPEEIYVSTSKSGNNVFSNILQARDYLRNNLLDRPVDVIIDSGEYKMATALEFTSADKRTLTNRVKYKAEKDAEVVFSGAKKLNISGFSKVTDENILSRVYESVRDSLLEIDLKQQGVASQVIGFTDKYDSGDSTTAYLSATVPYVYLNGALQTISQYPNEGYLTMGNAVRGAQQSDVLSGTKKITDGGNFYYNNADAISRWKTATDLYIKGYLYYTWIGEWAKVKNVNDGGLINLKYATSYGLMKGRRFKVVNLLEEIDAPGEWFIDKSTSKMYYLPPYQLTTDDVVEIAGMNYDLVNISNASYITFENIVFEKNRSDIALDGVRNYTTYNNGIEISNSQGINIYNCIIRNVAAHGITLVDKSYKVWVDACRIYNTGLNGVVLAGQNQDTLESTDCIISNCNISDVSLNAMNSAEAIQISTTGGFAENNVLHKNTTNAISYGGQENVIRNNEIYLASTETADSGAIYTGRRWDQPGNVIEKNYIHQIGPKENVGKEVWYVYMDDSHAGTTVKSNIMIGTNRSDVRAVQIAQGPNNIVNSNTFVNFGAGSLIDFSYRDGFADTLLESFANVKTESEVYKQKYPYLSELKKHFNNGVYNYKNYKENIETSNNISHNSGKMLNDSGATSWWRSNGGRSYGLPMYKTAVGNKENIGDVFVNSSNGDYRVKDTFYAPSDVLTEKNFDLNLIGVQKPLPDTKKFSLLSPVNGENKKGENVLLVWEASADADYYEYIVATDKNLTDVVKRGETTLTYINLDVMPDDSTYYWSVKGKTSSRASESWDCEKVYLFSTSSDENKEIVYGKLTATTDKGGDVTYNGGEKIIITDEITADTLTSDKVVYIFAVYDNSGRLLYTKINHAKVVTDSKPVKVLEFEMPKINNAGYYKLFRWKNFETLKPII